MTIQQQASKLLKSYMNPSALKWYDKELVKVQIANKYIGQGSAGSSTDNYRQMYETLGVANLTDGYESTDVIYVSSNGRRSNGFKPVKDNQLQGVYKLLDKAMKAGSTIVMDTHAHLFNTARYNIGELALAEYLAKNSYRRVSTTGKWKPIKDN